MRFDQRRQRALHLVLVQLAQLKAAEALGRFRPQNRRVRHRLKLVVRREGERLALRDLRQRRRGALEASRLERAVRADLVVILRKPAERARGGHLHEQRRGRADLVAAARRVCAAAETIGEPPDLDLKRRRRPQARFCRHVSASFAGPSL